MISVGVAALSTAGADLGRRPQLGQVAIPSVEPVKVVEVQNWAVKKALAHQRTLHPDRRPFVKYLWNRTGSWEGVQAASNALNVMVGLRASYEPRKVNLVDGDRRLLWIDMKEWLRNDRDVVVWQQTWTQFIDPDFSLIYTGDQVRNLIAQGFPFEKVLVPQHASTYKIIKGETISSSKVLYCKPGKMRYPDNSGRTCYIKEAGNYTFELQNTKPDVIEVKRNSFDADLLHTVDVLRLNPESCIDPLAFSELQNLGMDDSVIVSVEYMTFRGLRTIKDKSIQGKNDNQLYKFVWGGLYYEFAGIDKSPDPNLSDFQFLLKQLGVSEGQLNDFRSDRQGLIQRSLVTRKKRRWILLDGQRGKAGDNAVVSYTEDLDDANVDYGTDPFYNIIESTADAREVIFPLRNLYHGFALYNGVGVRQDRVPPDVTSDDTILTKYGSGSAELQPADSCLACHVTHNGYKPLPNETKQLLGYYRYRGIREQPAATGPRTDILYDFNLHNQSLSDQFDRINGLITGESTKFLLRGRIDYEEAWFKGCHWQLDDHKQAAYARLGAQRLVDTSRNYWYLSIGPKEALAEIGVICHESQAKDEFAKRCMQDPRAVTDGYANLRVPQGTTVFGSMAGWLEVSTLGSLAEGQRVNRSSWDLVKTYAADRNSWRNK